MWKKGWLQALSIATCLLVSGVESFQNPGLHGIRAHSSSKFLRNRAALYRERRPNLHFKMTEEPEEAAQGGMVGKAAWHAAEALGDVASLVTGKSTTDSDPGMKPRMDNIPKDIALERLKADYDRAYFVSGELDADLYEEDCLFAGISFTVYNCDHLALFVTAWLENVWLPGLAKSYTVPETTGHYFAGPSGLFFFRLVASSNWTSELDRTT
jgi:hypothetical protein